MRISLDGMSKADFLANDDKKAVAERYIMIVGEAAHMVSDRTKSMFPQIPWRDANIFRRHRQFNLISNRRTEMKGTSQ